MRAVAFAPPGVFPNTYSFTLGSGMVLDGVTKRLGYKFIMGQSDTITHVDFFLSITGVPASVQLTAEIQTDSSDTPSGTPVGTATAAFNAATGWQGEQALGSSAALTVNTAYWLVVTVSTVGNLSAGTVLYQARHCGTTAEALFTGSKVRNYNGADWTTVAALSAQGYAVLKSATKRYGVPFTAAESGSGQADIFGTNRQGLRIKFGVPTTIMGVVGRLAKTASPAALEVAVFEGSTEKQSASLAALHITTNTFFRVGFATPVELAADTNIYVVLRQLANGGDGSNDYDLRTYPCNSAIISALYPADMRMVAGTGDDPTGYSVIETEAPILAPLIYDPAADQDESAGGGTNIFVYAE